MTTSPLLQMSIKNTILTDEYKEDNRLLYDSIWKELEEAKQLETLEQMDGCKKDKKDKNILFDICTNCGMNESHFVHDVKSGDVICENCGIIVREKIIDNSELPSFVNENGTINNRSQSGFGNDWFNPNPNHNMSCTVGISYKNSNYNSYKTKKWVDRTSYNHKERSFWEVSKKIDDAAAKLNMPTTIIEIAKHMWGEITKSNILKRASTRRGMIACCLYYACIFNKVPRGQNEIAEGFGMDKSSDITKGDKIIREIFKDHPQYKVCVLSTSNANNMYERTCNSLGCDYQMAQICKKVDKQCKNVLLGMAPKSVCAGVICYVIKYIQKQKKPTKQKIAETCKICTPTMNKVLEIIIDYFKKNK